MSTTSETFRNRLSVGQMRHDRVFSIRSHVHVRLDSWRDIQPNDLVFTPLGDSVTGEVSHLGYLCGPEIVTGSGTMKLRDDTKPRVARPLEITFAATRSNGLIYASGQQWNDPSYAISDDFRSAEWRYVRYDDIWYEFCKELAPGENMVVARAELPDRVYGD